MSFYITCVNDDGCLSASFFPQLNLTAKYEMALVEVIFPTGLKFDKGFIRLFNSETKSIVARINLNNFSSVDGLLKYVKTLSISAESNQSQVVLKAGEKHIFKVSAEAQKVIGRNGEYTTTLTIDEAVFTKSQMAHLCCKLISEQIFGQKKRAILRTIKFPIQHQIFTHPHYVDVNSTSISNINICVRDENFNEIQVSGNPILKLHLRIKK
jgi:hypothetical protein